MVSSVYHSLREIIEKSLYPMARAFSKVRILALFSGVLIPLQSRINGELSHQMGDYFEAALFSFGIVLIFVSLIALYRKNIEVGSADILKRSLHYNFHNADLALEC